ncbi:uncharacterized protein EURHEDRAFT_403291 [Aspergillus ruber CBS 135680]|uniref:Arrestin-like N-terminal domain-containing protein n=1 Tax=Aspergillus ruber (strain CBS 135680) TaxID=1388766 RepID=A0A017SCS6_ASPRC|nr:uncharacterized protein EURHEDRAFT_403291 [Aspergillus ruber CBS 135680]EYE94752.1 hypothetical protein EURHEDRAFT_403291 [Aspergillus ruber CBS 135680]
MQLFCPSKHTIFLDTNGESHCVPLSGTIRLDEPAELSSLSLTLMQTILVDNERHTSGYYNHKERSPKKWFQRHKPKEQQYNPSSGKISFATEILHCNLSTLPTSYQTCDHGFSLSIPCDIPASIGTLAYNISYELVASATTTSGRDLTTRQTLQICSVKIPGPQEVFHYVRTFPETKLRAEFILCPQLLASDEQRSGKHISAQLLLRDVATPGPRHGELTMVVVKEVTWHVEEIQKWNLQHTEGKPITITRQKRTIATSGLKGRWTGAKLDAVNVGAEDTRIPIPFDITIDSGADALTDFTSEHSLSAPFLAVKHRLTVTVVTGSETVNRETGSLVDKRDTVRVLGATVPIPVHEYAEASVVSERLGASDGMLPQYDGSGTPPNYSELLQRCI